jgi:hypothetical protein
MRALEQDGAIPLSEDEKLARRFQTIFGLNEREARRAAHGHGGSSVEPVSESAGPSSAAPQPGDALRLVGKIEELAANLCRRGVAEDKALRDAAFEVMRCMPDERSADWVVRVASRFWPSIYAS